ncbi:hypothetical protein BJX62DRAFT_192464 [Aspergillus germanicus]
MFSFSLSSCALSFGISAYRLGKQAYMSWQTSCNIKVFSASDVHGMSSVLDGGGQGQFLGETKSVKAGAVLSSS